MAILTLALGIGFSTSMFSLVDGLWLEPYPFPDAEELVVLSGFNPENDIEESGVSLPDALDLQSSSRALEDLAVFWYLDRSLTGDGNARRLNAVGTTPNLFSILGTDMQVGRGFTAEEAASGMGKVVVLSDHIWQRDFGADPKLVGDTIEIDGEASTVVGVLPPGGQFPDTDRGDVFVPLGRDPQRLPRQGRPFTGVARLADDVTLESAQAELNSLAASLESDHPMTNRGWRIRVHSLREIRTREFEPLLPLVFLIALILLIACANVGNLMLQRAARRTSEIAIRSAHGASRGRLVRQLLVESGTLAVASAIAGLAIAFLLLRVTVRLIPVALPSTLELQLDGRAILFAFAVAVVTTALAGMAPALFASSRSPARDLAASQRTVSGDSRSRRLADGLLVLQVALALVLVIGALLTVRSFDQLNTVDPGFTTDGVVTMDVNLPAAQYQMPPQKLAFFRQALENVGAVAGVQAVGLGSRLPFDDSFTTTVNLEGQTPEEAETNPSPQFQNVYGDLFGVLDLPLLAGRYFEAGDRMGSESVVVVSARLADRLWPDEDAVGQRLRYSMQREEGWSRVVGVVGDIRFENLAVEPAGDLYIPFPQLPMGGLNLFARVAGDPSQASPAIRQAIRRIDPNVPVEDLRRLETVVDDSIWLERMTSVLFSLLATAALVLTLVGIYASIAYSVARRHREIGIRMAFGSDRTTEAARVVKRALGVTALGAVIGIVGAVLLARYLSTKLFGIVGPEPWTFGLAVFLLLAGAALAALAPSWRAARLNPVTALRSE